MGILDDGGAGHLHDAAARPLGLADEVAIGEVAKEAHAVLDGALQGVGGPGVPPAGADDGGRDGGAGGDGGRDEGDHGGGGGAKGRGRHGIVTVGSPADISITARGRGSGSDCFCFCLCLTFCDTIIVGFAHRRAGEMIN